MPENDDPLARLPTWQLVCLMLASTSAAGSAFFLMGALVLGWPGATAGIVVFCLGGLATALLKPRT